ncbi:hypothetical protein [Candidatus Sororendozoicomonas aggregata]|uniref:hypothetical protein n=1 Tax=Candidatus Sororendozoicomonas aggregata TaxID=3073239 RepID=UPI002ED3B549
MKNRPTPVPVKTVVHCCGGSLPSREGQFIGQCCHATILNGFLLVKGNQWVVSVPGA